MKNFLSIFIIVLALCSCQLHKGISPSLTSIPKAPSLLSDARKAYDNGEFKTAEEKYETLARSDRNNPIYYVGMGDARRRQGNYDKAIEAYKDALALDNKNADAIEGIGLTRLEQGKVKEAIESFMKVLEVDAVRWKSLNALGVAYDLSDKHELAMEYYESALALSNDSPVVMNNMGLGHAFLGEYDDAIRVLNRAVSRFGASESKQKMAEMNLALVYGLAGRTSEAESILRKYLTEAQVYNNLGIYAHLANDNDLAQTYLNMALSASPEFYQSAWDSLQRVEPLVTPE